MSRRLGVLAVIAALLVVPYFFETFWLTTGLFCMAAAVAAIGLTLLVGVTGQLSLAHAFFIAIGAYGYCYLAGSTSPGPTEPSGLGLPTWLAALGAVLLAGVVGALFSPIAGRLRGIYLGLASLGLVFIGQHILFNASGVTGGFNGRGAEPFSVLGLRFDDGNGVVIGGVTFGAEERLWYLGLVLVLASWWFARNLVRSRPGRALQQVRDSEVAAAVMGVNVPLYKGAAFMVSSMYAALGGVFLALVFTVVTPDSFDFAYSIDFLIMIVLGGLGSIGGAVAGAVLVTATQQLFDKYAGSLPLVSASGGGGLEAGQAASLIYGLAIIVVLIFAPQGLAGLLRRLTGHRHTRSPSEARKVQPKESTA